MKMSPTNPEQEQHTFLDAPAVGEYPVPHGARREQCKSCGAPIVWGTTQHGKPIPLSISKIRCIGGQRYSTTHYTDCPHAKEWRRKP